MQKFVFTDKTRKPGENEINETLGKTLKLWKDIHDYIGRNYDFIPETVFFTKNYGWTVRYRRNGKTLCYLFPGKGTMTALIVLGAKETEKVYLMKERLNKKIMQTVENTEPLHDGRWTWFEINNGEDISSIKILLTAKRKPNPNET